MTNKEFLRNIDPSLTDDDLKVIKHLKAIDNLFNRGDLTISELFANTSCMQVLKNYNGEDYVISEFHNIDCDGGDPDMMGPFGVRQYSEWIDLMDEENLNQLD